LLSDFNIPNASSCSCNVGCLKGIFRRDISLIVLNGIRTGFGVSFTRVSNFFWVVAVRTEEENRSSISSVFTAVKNNGYFRKFLILVTLPQTAYLETCSSLLINSLFSYLGNLAEAPPNSFSFT
jgi:hypothetical protein